MTDDERRSVAVDRRFEAVWEAPSGFPRWFSTVNQSEIGKWFLFTGFGFFIVGGLLALLMRTQLAVPESTFLTHEQYNRLFTMHGTTRLFLFAVPILEGFATYLIPMMIGARDLPFPRMTAFGYWCYLFGGLLVYASFFVGEAPDGAWFMYPPLSDSEFLPGRNIDYWLLGITLTEIAGIVAAIDLIVAIFKLRAPGMSMNRMPLFAWNMLVVAFMILFAFPPLILADVMLELQRTFDFPFFDPVFGGSSDLWQHLFWIFGHPEVYIIFLPAAGFISMIIPTFSRRPIVGYTWVAVAAVATGFASFGLWVHHMYTTGLPQMSMNFFAAASLTVAIPSGIQVFAWLATIWNGRPVIKTPMLFAIGFLVLFVIGGLTGVTVAVVPFDWQVHDTYYLVAHFHYVLFGGMVFPLFAAFYYWFPVLTGRVLSERLGKWHFWLLFIGFNVTFFTMHVTGFLGMPRQVYTYPADMNWSVPNAISTLGAFVLAVAILIFLVNVFRSLRGRERSPENPWNAAELEWASGLPAPGYGFRTIPEVRSRYPQWDQEGLAGHIKGARGYLAQFRGRRETLGTSLSDAKPQQVIVLPGPSYLPIVTALLLTLALVGVFVKQFWISIFFAVLLVVALAAWLWPREGHLEEEVDAGELGVLPVNSGGRGSLGWWGMLGFITSSGVMFVYLLVSYLFLRSRVSDWPPPGISAPEPLVPLVAVVLTLASAAAAYFAVRRIRRDDRSRLRVGSLIAAVFGAAAFAVALIQMIGFEFDPTETAYGAAVFTIAGFFVVHLLLMAVMSAVVALRAGDFRPRRSQAVSITSMGWIYVAVIGIATLLVVYAGPYLW